MGCDMAWTFALPLEAALSLRPSNSALEQWGLASQVAGIQQCSEPECFGASTAAGKYLC